MDISSKDYDGDEAQKQFEAIPKDRIFYTLHLFLTEDNMIGGAGFHDGSALKRLGVGPMLATQAKVVGRVATNAAAKAVQRLGALSDFGSILDDLLKSVAPDTKEDNSDSKQSSEPATGGDSANATVSGNS